MTGRWPANVILSPCMADALDEQSGVLKSGPSSTKYQRGESENACMSGKNYARTGNFDRPADSGGASRFFLRAGYEPWELEWILANGLTPYGMETQ